MTPALIRIDSHLFSPDALQAFADHAANELQPGKRVVVTFGFDAEGGKVAVLFKLRDGALKLHTAFGHDWDGDNKVGIGGSVSF